MKGKVDSKEVIKAVALIGDVLVDNDISPEAGVSAMLAMIKTIEQQNGFKVLMLDHGGANEEES